MKNQSNENSPAPDKAEVMRKVDQTFSGPLLVMFGVLACIFSFVATTEIGSFSFDTPYPVASFMLYLTLFCMAFLLVRIFGLFKNMSQEECKSGSAK